MHICATYSLANLLIFSSLKYEWTFFSCTQPAVVEVSGPSIQDQQHLEEMWKRFDQDGNGELDQAEFRNALRLLNIVTNDEFLEVYNCIDTNNNGMISIKEFSAWWFNEDATTSSYLESMSED